MSVLVHLSEVITANDRNGQVDMLYFEPKQVTERSKRRFYTKVIYRKQIARQHSCRKNVWLEQVALLTL